MNRGVTSINHPITFEEVYAVATSTFLNSSSTSTVTVGYLSGGWALDSVTTTSITRKGYTNGTNPPIKLIVVGS